MEYSEDSPDKRPKQQEKRPPSKRGEPPSKPGEDSNSSELYEADDFEEAGSNVSY